MDNILITGAAGFVGSHLIDFCISRGCKVYGLDIPNIRIKNLRHYTNGKTTFSLKEKQFLFGSQIQIPTNNSNLILIECDLTNKPLLERILYELKPSLIFHFGAQPYIIPSYEDPAKTIEINVIGTLNIFEPIKKFKLKSRVILACTSTEFGTTAIEVKRPLREEDSLMAIHPYGISKIAAELLARQYFMNFGIEAINIRFFNLTGIRRVNDACSDFVKMIAQIELGLTEPTIQVGNLSPFRDILSINDAIRGIWLIATKGKPGETYHLCSNKKIQIKEVLNLVLGFSSKKIQVIENSPEKLRKTDEDAIVGDNSKIKRELGIEIVEPLEKTLKDMFDYWIEYYKTNND